jgi:hypothetical protein
LLWWHCVVAELCSPKIPTLAFCIGESSGKASWSLSVNTGSTCQQLHPLALYTITRTTLSRLGVSGMPTVGRCVDRYTIYLLDYLIHEFMGCHHGNRIDSSTALAYRFALSCFKKHHQFLRVHSHLNSSHAATRRARYCA